MVDEIKSALADEGFAVRIVVNIKHWKTKDPLHLFFINLESIEFSESIYKLQYLLYTKVQVESPKLKRDFVQCMRC